MRITEARPVAPDQPFVIDRFRPEDAAGVASLFVSVYGPEYPMPQYYDTDWLTAANASGELVSVVARTPCGDIVSHMGAYRSSPVNPKLYELGIGLTLVAYRAQRASGEIMKYLVGELRGLPLVGAFGEGVCNHTGMQKIGLMINLVTTGVEVDLMPAEAYAAERSAEGRVSCVLSYLPLHDAPQTLHVPERYADLAHPIFDAFPEPRSVVVAGGRPTVAASRVDARIFDFAAVSRSQVTACGEDIGAVLERIEEQAQEQRCTTRQAFLNLGDPGIGAAADWLRAHGYSFGGFAPRWFDGDGLLLQKLMHAPGFSRIQLLGDRAHRVMRMVEDDWRALNPGRPTA